MRHPVVVSKSGWRRIIIGSMVMMMLFAGVHYASGLDMANFSAAREVDQRAEHAAIVMRLGLDPVVSRDAAWRVVTPGVPSVEALSADGTNWQGHLVLRITVSKSPNTLNSQTATRCYRYTFDHANADASPDRLDDCPAGPALVRKPPPLPMDLNAAQTRSLSNLLNALSPA